MQLSIDADSVVLNHGGNPSFVNKGKGYSLSLCFSATPPPPPPPHTDRSRSPSSFTKMEGEEDTVPRFQIFSMHLWFEENCSEMVTDNNDSAIDFKKPFRIFMSDDVRVHEIYNSVKLKELYEDLDDIILKKPKRRKGSCISSGEEKELEDSVTSPKRRKEEGWVSNSKNHINLPVMGPNGDIVPRDYFHVIIHQDTSHPETDKAHLVKATPYYLKGDPLTKSDIVESSVSYGPPYFYQPFPFVVVFPFGHLDVVGMMYEPSWLVTVSVYWENNHHHIAESSYIRGKLIFGCEAYPTSCALLPEDKVIKVEHGVSIRLLRSAFAVPRVSGFTVDADLDDPINNSSVDGWKDFDFNDFSKTDYSQSKVIVGKGAKIKVELTMKPNDFLAIRNGPAQ